MGVLCQNSAVGGVEGFLCVSDRKCDRKSDRMSDDRMSAEPQPGSSRYQPSRQGYCGYCRVLYTNLDQV